jgi:uncharacterized SAM-binding protein YcdF (DUF218 family)
MTALALAKLGCPGRLRRVALALTALLLVGVVALAGGFAWFVLRAGRADLAPPQADGIVVLTGGAGRVELALRLLAEGRAPQLLVSGTGPGDIGDIVARAGIDSGLSARLPPGAITLGRGARTTRGNATETTEWVAAHALHSLLVVTSGYHMQRALVELRRALPPGVALYPVPLVPRAADGHDRPPLRLLASEYAKWLAAALGMSSLAAREDERPAPTGRGPRMGG